MLQFLFLQNGKLFGSHVLINKRRLTGNRLGSTRLENKEKITTATPLVSLTVYY